MQSVFLASSRVQQTIVVILVGAAYYFGAQAGLAMSVHPDHVATFWPPNAIILGALIFTHPRRWWAYFAIMTVPYLTGDLSLEFSFWRTVIYYIANCSEILIAALAIRYFLGGRLKFDSLREMAIFLVSAALIAPLVSASIASFSPRPLTRTTRCPVRVCTPGPNIGCVPTTLASVDSSIVRTGSDFTLVTSIKSPSART